MKKIVTLIIFGCISSTVQSQISLFDETDNTFDKIEYYIVSDWYDTQSDCAYDANDYFEDGTFSKTEIEKALKRCTDKLKSSRKEVLGNIEVEIVAIEKARKSLSKDMPYVPKEGKQLIDIYSRSLFHLEEIKDIYISESDNWISFLKENFAKNYIPDSLLAQPDWFERKNLKNFKDELTAYETPYVFQLLHGYENQVQFMKKHKLDSLVGYYSDESANCYIGYNTSAGNCGLYEVDYLFNPKSVIQILNCSYDSIQYDHQGYANWSTAIGWLNGKAVIAEKMVEYLDHFVDNYDILRYPSPRDVIAFTDLKYGMVKGYLATINNNNNWVIIDADKDSVISLEYPSYYSLPGVNRKGEILTYKKDHKKISYYASDQLEFYTENNTYQRFHRNGKIMIVENRIPTPLNGFYDGVIEVYDRNGKHYGSGTIHESEIIDFTFYHDIGDRESRMIIKDSIAVDSVFYPSGNLHSTGVQKISGNSGGIKIDYYDGLGVPKPIFHFDDHHKDSLWSYYYNSGLLGATGHYFEGRKVGKWQYYNPLGEKVEDETYKRDLNVEMIFPYRMSEEDTSLQGFMSKKNNQAILYDINYQPWILELWDIEKNKQLKPAFNIPLNDVSGFIGENIIIGGSLKGDVFECYDFVGDSLFYPNTVDYDKIEDLMKLAGNEKMHSSSISQFNIDRKLDIRKLLFQQDQLLVASDSGFAYQINLRTGQLLKTKNVLEANGIDTLKILTQQIQESYYVNHLESDDIDVLSTGGQEFSKVVAKNTPDWAVVERFIYYGVGHVSFENTNISNPLERFVRFEMNENGEYFFFTPDNYYMGSKGLKDLVFFKEGQNYYEFEQFDLKYNRPDIILNRLGYADSTLVQAYHKAYQKRLKKMGFTEDMLKDDFHIPEIKIENFEYMPSITDSTKVGLNLHLYDNKYKLDRINIWINDVAVYGSDGISLRDKDLSEYKFTFDVNLVKGHNKIQVSVLNQAGAESYKETVEIESTGGKSKPDLYLISIGETEFEDSNYNLTYAAKDAEDIAALFSKSVVYHKVFTKTLTNAQVTKSNIEALRGFIAQAGINDEVILFIAGHGVLDKELDYFFATYDMNFNNPSKKGIAYEDLEGLLDGIKPLKKVLLIDACHSGEIDKEEVVLAQNTTKVAGVQFRAVGNTVKAKLGVQNTSELTKSLFTDLRKGTGATVISSAGGMEFAMESDDWQNGLFTYCLINGIQTMEADFNQDGEIWLSELKQYVSEQVTELSNGKQQPTSRIENQILDYRVW